MTDWLIFFLFGPGVGMTLYVVLQVVVVWKLAGVLRILAWIPVPIMILVVKETIEAYQAESNLWPLAMIFGGPIAAVYLAVLLVVDKVRARRRERAGGAVIP